MALATQNPRFRHSRQKHGGRRGGVAKGGGKGHHGGGGEGRTRRARPGLGATDVVSGGVCDVMQFLTICFVFLTVACGAIIFFIV